MIIRLEKITPTHAGEAICLSFLIENEGNAEKRELVIGTDAYFSLDKLFAGMVISRENFEKLEEAAKLHTAINRGLYLLSFGDNNRARLVSKLMHRGHTKAHAEIAAQYLVEKGYIDEKEQLRMQIMHLANNKLLGKRRIISELYNKRYDYSLIEEIYAECEGAIDFEENKRKLLEKKFGTPKPKPANHTEYAKIKAFLYRYGY